MLLPEIFLNHVLPDNVCWRVSFFEPKRGAKDLRACHRIVIIQGKFLSFLFLECKDDLMRCDELVIVLLHKLVKILFSLSDMLEILFDNSRATFFEQGNQWPVVPGERQIGNLDTIEAF